MSTKVRGSVTAAVIAFQALAAAAWAQEPDTQTSPDREGISPDRPSSDWETKSQDRSTAEQSMPASSTDRSTSGMKGVSPQTFASQAASISKAEIELSQLALDKSKDKQVRDYAQRMVRDHSAADAKLKKAAAAEGIDLPKSPDAQQQAIKQKLASLEGEAFDREYKKEMAKGHDKAVALFESAAQSSQMPDDLKQFAASTLPTLKDHKQQAYALHENERG